MVFFFMYIIVHRCKYVQLKLMYVYIDYFSACHPKFQIITIRDYVPKIIGLESLERYVGPYRGYDPTEDASASNVFATAAFRFGHGTIPPILSRLNASFQEHEQYPHLRIHESFFSPWRIVKEGQCTLLRAVL